VAKLKYLDLRRKVIAACLRMNAQGINQGTSGNVSARMDHAFLITASGIPYDRMRLEHVIEMDFDGGYYGAYLPSTEWRMHMDIYRQRPEARVIIHTHSIYATALACLRKDIPSFHYMIGVGGGATIRCSDYAEFGTQGLSDTMLKALDGRTACLLANHGQIVFGQSLEKALWLAGEVETICHQYWAALQAGAPVILSETEMRTVLARFKTYGKQQEELGPAEMHAVQGPVRRDHPPARKQQAS